MKKKNAFTLVEMLAVIVILGLMMIITFPKILEMITKQEDQVDTAQEKLIFSATETYLNEKSDFYPAREGKNYCIPLSDLEREGYLSIDAEELNLNQIVSIQYVTEDKYEKKLIEDTEENRVQYCTSEPNTNPLTGLRCNIAPDGYAIEKSVTITYPLKTNDTLSYCYSIDNGSTWETVRIFNEGQISGKGVHKLVFRETTDNNKSVLAKVVIGNTCNNPSLESATCTAKVTGIDKTKIGEMVTITAENTHKIGKGYLKADGSLVSRTTYKALYESLDFSKNTIQTPPNNTTFYLPKEEGKMVKYQ